MKNSEQQLMIQSIFFKYLRRAPSDAELHFWLNQLTPEMAYEDVRKAFENELRYEITLTGLTVA